MPIPCAIAPARTKRPDKKRRRRTAGRVIPRSAFGDLAAANTRNGAAVSEELLKEFRLILEHLSPNAHVKIAGVALAHAADLRMKAGVKAVERIRHLRAEHGELEEDLFRRLNPPHRAAERDVDIADHDPAVFAHHSWCPYCQEPTMPLDDGNCGFCSTPVTEMPR